MHKVLPYNFGVNSITTDINCITPGMIYVDINHKSLDDFFVVFQNGASLIITDSSFFDNNLPIVKVKNVEWAYFNLLNILYENILNKVSFIAVYGGSQGNIIVNILNTIFKKCCFSINQSDCNTTFFNAQAKLNSGFECFFHHIIDCFIHGINTIPVSMDFDSGDNPLKGFISGNIDCLILENGPYLDIIDKSCEAVKKPIITNIDKPNNLALINKNEDFIITYGLSKKASVTATSIDYGEYTNFNYCLQRSFMSKTHKVLEPFETPLSIRGLGINRIYSALAAISCALYYDMDMKHIEESLMEYSEKGRNLLIKGYEKFTLIDNFCIDYSGVKETFEMVQLLDYQSLYMLISYKLFSKIQSEPEIARNFLELIMSANVKEIVISDFALGCDKDLNFKIVMEVSKQNNIDLKMVSGLANAITHILNNIDKKDALLILGGKEFNTSKIITELLLAEEIC